MTIGMYKEADHFFNEWYVKQERIYNDACDAGIPVLGNWDPLCLDLKHIFADTGKWGGFMSGIKKHRFTGYYQDGSLQFSTVSVYLPWEPAGDKYRCTKWMITYNNDVSRKKQFISFTPCEALRKEHEIWEG